MIANDPTIIILTAVLLAGMAWVFAKGDALGKVGAVVVAGYVLVQVVTRIDEPRQPLGLEHVAMFTGAMAAGLFVWRYLGPLVPVVIVAGLAVIGADGLGLGPELAAAVGLEGVAP